MVTVAHTETQDWPSWEFPIFLPKYFQQKVEPKDIQAGPNQHKTKSHSSAHTPSAEEQCQLWGSPAAARAHSLVRNASENDVVQEGDLLSQLHGRQGLKALGLRTVRLQEMRAGNETHRKQGACQLPTAAWSTKSTLDPSYEENGRKFRNNSRH